jgi:hypothetical protein
MACYRDSFTLYAILHCCNAVLVIFVIDTEGTEGRHNGRSGSKADPKKANATQPSVKADLVVVVIVAPLGASATDFVGGSFYTVVNVWTL